MSIQPAKFATGFLLICACAAAHAAMYRWVDENGVTVYSQTPPPSGDAVKLEKERAPSEQSIEATKERLRLQREKAFDEEEAKKEAAAKQEEQAEIDQSRAENCAAARANLYKLQNLGPRRILTPDGRTLRLSEDEVQTQIEKAQGQIDTNCN